jgi:hypothetical protein
MSLSPALRSVIAFDDSQGHRQVEYVCKPFHAGSGTIDDF